MMVSDCAGVQVSYLITTRRDVPKNDRLSRAHCFLYSAIGSYIGVGSLYDIFAVVE